MNWLIIIFSIVIASLVSEVFWKRGQEARTQRFVGNCARQILQQEVIDLFY